MKRATNAVTISATIALCLALCGTAQAQTKAGTAPVYAVMSLVGDSLSVVSYSGVPAPRGSRVDQSRRTDVVISENAFDASALNAIAEMVRKQEPTAAQEILETRNAALRTMQERIFDNTDAAKKVRESLRALLLERNAGKLILVTKHRAEAQFGLAAGTIGGGVLDGLGFCIDNSLLMPNLPAVPGTYGMMNGFMFATVFLVDAKTMTVIRQSNITGARTLSRGASVDNEVTTWDKLSEVQKVRFLQSLIRDSLDAVVPKLLNPVS